MSTHSQTIIRRAGFGKSRSGEAVEIYTLTNCNRAEVSILTYGGIVQSLKMPDREGRIEDVVLGFDEMAGYEENSGSYFGAVIGRCANRIGGGRFCLGGTEYRLERNHGAHTLHGGARGFDKAMWRGRETGSGGLELSYRSQDCEQGFPGNLQAAVQYHLTDSNELRIEYSATTDRRTVINLTNHSYFNLRGAGEGDVLKHRLTMDADRFTPVDEDLIPTGELREVTGTAFDFREACAMGERMDSEDAQLRRANGYDHNWALNGVGIKRAARVADAASGRLLEVWTTEPGMQFYVANFAEGSMRGKGGKAYAGRGGFCLETQHFPDSPNRPEFPTVTLMPGETYRSTTVFKFSAE